MYKSLIHYTLHLALVVSFAKCSEREFDNSPQAKLAFSIDTVKFGTVF